MEMEIYNMDSFSGKVFSDGRGIALAIVGRETEEETEFQVNCDELDCGHYDDYCFEEITSIVFTGRLIAVMIGDDKRFLVDFEDLTEIDDEEFCLGCGQVGCGHWLERIGGD